MVRKIDAFQDGKGVLHTCAADAHRADLSAWFHATGVMNEAAAAALAKALVDDRAKMFELVSMMETLARDVPAETVDLRAQGAA
jgi:hypothetical protein